MSVQLLDKTRKINKLLHNNNSHKVVFNDICKVLSEILLSNILVISKKGKVLGTVPSERKVVVEGCNMVTCHIKPRRQGEEGGIVKREAAIAACKVQVVCPKCNKGTRVAHKIEGDKKIRVCKHCGAEL